MDYFFTISYPQKPKGVASTRVAAFDDSFDVADHLHLLGQLAESAPALQDGGAEEDHYLHINIIH